MYTTWDDRLSSLHACMHYTTADPSATPDRFLQKKETYFTIISPCSKINYEIGN
jgi:hypothetical protein